MKTYRIVISNTYEEIYEVQAETEHKAIIEAVKPDAEPVQLRRAAWEIVKIECIK